MTKKVNILILLRKLLGIVTKAIVVSYQRIYTGDFASNIVVTINLWSELIKLPINHRLPLYSYLYKDYSTNLLRIAKYISDKYKTYTAIDVGANIGDSAILIRKGSNAKIFCIEGDSMYLKILKSNLKYMDNIKIINSMVGEKNGYFKGVLNKSGGTGQLGLKRSQRKISIRRLDTIIKEKRNIKLVKIDTDGFDGRVIRGSNEIISTCNPVIFFEFDQNLYDSNGDSTYEILKLLYNKNYNHLLIYDNYGKLIRGFIMNTFISKKRYGNIFNYKNEDYYDLVAFNIIDKDLFKTSLISEIKYFENKK